VEGSPEEIAADPRVREVYLGGAQHTDLRQAEVRGATAGDD
jgi:hypothetical protein